MRYYPLFMDLHGTNCLVLGAGSVGRRKIATLLECAPASVLVLDPNQDALAAAKALPCPPETELRCEAREFRAGDLCGVSLAFAATPQADVNSMLARACRERGILCNTSGPLQDAGGNFLVPSHIENGPMILALSTGGGSPALAKALREELEQSLDKGYALLIRLLEALRQPLIAMGLGSAADARVFRALCARPLRQQLMTALQEGDAEKTDALLRPVLPAGFRFSAKEFLHGLD